MLDQIMLGEITRLCGRRAKAALFAAKLMDASALVGQI
jgi:hypothetical protein